MVFPIDHPILNISHPPNDENGTSAARSAAEQALVTAWSKLCGTGVEASIVA
jgi:hypothetical protein